MSIGKPWETLATVGRTLGHLKRAEAVARFRPTTEHEFLGVSSTGFFFFDKSKNASQAAEIVHGVYGADTVTANYEQFWFRRFRSGIFDVKDAPLKGRPVVENVDKITEIIEVDRHVSGRSITQELKINHKTVLKIARTHQNHFHSNRDKLVFL
ncbi:histone-lysine N-methyltransferase SETMAR [Trichonephila clavipes]|uniref:Histone-lysine N-methyltransferase SETMAR n=1 Tax=Trichonephila clavipes TaxID=2585209 RepID=A0A8X6RX15_TRICX|nr:histone-lysine N-methyltransferase SETMAR [Trichonephila clavipes]